MDRITIVCDRPGHPLRHPRVVVARYERDSDTWRRIALIDRIDDWHSWRHDPIQAFHGNEPVDLLRDADGALYYNEYEEPRHGRDLEVRRRVNVEPQDVRDLHRLTCPHCFTTAQDSYGEDKLFPALDLAAGAGVSMVTMAGLAAIVQATAEGRSAN